MSAEMLMHDLVALVRDSYCSVPESD